MTSTPLASTGSGLSTKQKVGVILCILYSLSNVPSVLEAPADGEAGPPMAILVVDTVLGVVGIVAGVMAWRGNRVALRVAAGAIIVLTLTGLPAFFVDMPMFIKVIVAVSVVLTLITVALMFSGERRATSVAD